MISLVPVNNKVAVVQDIDHVQLYFSEAMNWIVHFLPHLIAGILLWFVGRWLINNFVKLTQKIMVSREFDISLQSFFTSLLSFGLKVMLLFSIAGVIGIESSAFLTTLGAAGLAIGLSLQGSLSNFAGGVIILVFRPFQVGDIIEAQGQSGVVKDIRILHTLVQTGLKKMVYIPNGILSNGVIINSSSLGVLVFEIKFDIDRTIDVTALRNLIIPIMEKDPRILKDPLPSVNIADIGNGITISITGLTSVSDNDAVKGNLRDQIRGLLVSNSILHPQNHTYVHNVAQAGAEVKDVAQTEVKI